MNHLTATQPSTRALIDLNAFRGNLQAVRNYVGPSVKILAVVKAGAYGHGGPRLAAEAVRWGVEYLGVARIHEGLELRAAGITLPILVFEIPPEDQCETALEQDLELTVSAWSSALAIDRASRKLRRRSPVHVKVDTGMGRLGVVFKEAVPFVLKTAGLDGITVKGLYSHFATSEDPDQTYARLQLRRLLEIDNELKKDGVQIPLRHMANSGAIIAIPESHLDMVRPGIMLYGYPPASGTREPHPVKPVLSLQSRVTFLKSVEPGTPISYGSRYVTRTRTNIATVPVGYADGYPRLLTGKAECLIRGRRYPVVGTICMDALMIDLGPESEVAVGDTVTFIGSDGSETITAWDLAERIGTIPYEITSGINSRVPRILV